MSDEPIISDFEQRIFDYMKEHDYGPGEVLTAAAEYCELCDVDYDNLMNTVGFSGMFIEAIRLEAVAKRLIESEQTNAKKIDVI